MAAAFPDPRIRLYSMKANPLPALVAEIALGGFGVSAVSRGELASAALAGVAPRVTALEGIGKTSADLAEAARLARAGTPLLWVSLESAEDAAALAALDTPMDVLVRANPASCPKPMPVWRWERRNRVRRAAGGAAGRHRSRRRGQWTARWRGVHLHIGSQLGAVDAWRSAFRTACACSRRSERSWPTSTRSTPAADFVAFGEPESVPAVAKFAAAARRSSTRCQRSRPKRLAIEPGRALVPSAARSWRRCCTSSSAIL